MTDRVTIYVHGSCHFSERLQSDEAVGNGGYGVVITSNGQRAEEISGGFSNTTNARMDIIGITEGLKKINNPSEIVVYLTNGYVVDALSKGWLEKWKKKGYKKIKHVDLWRVLDSVLQETLHSISFRHSRDVKQSADFQKAEHLGKIMSGKKNMPNDLGRIENSSIDIFDASQLIKNNPTENLGPEGDSPILDGICVDASCIENPGKMEYRGVETKTGKVI